MRCVVTVLSTIAAASVALAQAPAPQQAPAQVQQPASPFTWGGDVRLREEYFNNVHADKTGKEVANDENNYFRLRPRAWMKWDPSSKVSLYMRLANESRYYMEPDADESASARAQVRKWKFPDETVVDNLYIELKGLLGGKTDIKIGRQDLNYGTGKLVLEGTPNDGSRTIFFDAIKITCKRIPKTTVDFFGIYNMPTNNLAIGDESGWRPVVTGLEKGGGVYAMNKAFDAVPFEVYYMFKSEEPYVSGTVTNITRDINTVGFRVMPKNGRLSANFEAAYQFGQDARKDITGAMIDALVSYQLIDSANKPTIHAGCYYLSGDDPTTADKDEGWNPLWARYPQNSELYVFAYGGPGRWSNITMPFIRASAGLTKEIRVKAQISDVTAPEDDGPGTGHRRGLLCQVFAEFDICKGLTGHVLADVLKEGNYYRTYETEVFARWQLMYVF
jgi:hypothetical protein